MLANQSKKVADRFNQIPKAKQKLVLPIRYLPVYLNHDIPLTLLRHGDTNLIFQIKSVAELTNFLKKVNTLPAYNLLNFLKVLKSSRCWDEENNLIETC